MPYYWTAIIAAAILSMFGIVVALFDKGHKVSKGGNVWHKKHCNDCCDNEPAEPLEIIVKVKIEPIELNVNFITPEPEVRGILTIGPVTEKKDKGI